jgi:hypothetical protein
MQISDQGLLRTQAYVDGQWIDADGGIKESWTGS